ARGGVRGGAAGDRPLRLRGTGRAVAGPGRLRAVATPGADRRARRLGFSAARAGLRGDLPGRGASGCRLAAGPGGGAAERGAAAARSGAVDAADRAGLAAG